MAYRRVGGLWALRWDIFLTVLLAFLLGSGAQWCANQLAHGRYEAYQAEHAAEEGTVGAPAADDLVRAKTMADLENNQFFTLEMDHVTYISNSPGPWIDGFRWSIFTLEDGTRIAAKVNGNSVVYRDTSVGYIISKEAILPIGTLIREPLTDEQIEAMDQYRGVTVTDCYIDMEGGHATISENDFTDYMGLVAFFIVFVLSFFFIRLIGVRTKIFPRIIPKAE